MQCGPILTKSIDMNVANPREARAVLQGALDAAGAAARGARYTNEALNEARAKFDAGREAERAAFAAAVADWRRGSGPVTVEREADAAPRAEQFELEPEPLE